MPLEPDNCYRAILARDSRFDGRFFVAVSSTRIYCRPVCTVKPPRREHCSFYASAAAAEAAGYRPCLRCRPELAPGYSSIDAVARLAQGAARLIEDGAFDQGDVAALAKRLGVSDRHLRRVFRSEFGVTPVAFAQTQRLLLAKRLLTDTRLPVTDVAFASGFGSLRRFNALFRSRYRLAPAALRKAGASAGIPDSLVFRLAFRPPYDWPGQLAFLGARAVAGVEHVDGGCYRRSVHIARAGKAHRGWLAVTLAPRAAALTVTLSASLAGAIPAVLARVKDLMDLGCNPLEVAQVLGPLAADRPGLRLPGAFDGFEVAVRAILGQQVSVAAARTLAGRVAGKSGSAISTPFADISLTFPDAATLANANPALLSACGITAARVHSIQALARAVRDGAIALRADADVEQTLQRLRVLPGVGEWTAQYIAMRCLGWPDAFPHTDLAVMKALGESRPARVLERAEAWRPWRAYATLHLWRSMSKGD